MLLQCQAAAPMAEATLPRQATDLHVSISQRSNKEHSLSPTAQHMKDSSASEEVSCIRPTTIEGNGLVLTTAQSRLSTADADHTEHSGHSTATSSPSPSGKCDTSPTSLTLAAVPQLPASSGTTGAFQLSSSASGIRTSGDSELGSLSSKQEQEIAVLSLIAGVAADAAAATVVSAPTAEAGSAAAENAVAVSAVQADSSAAALAYTAEADSAAPTGADVAGAVEATTSSDSWDDSISASDNILHALRSDAGVPDQWQVVKAGRKAPSHPGKASERHSDSSADQGSMLTGAEAACVASKLLRRSSSSASASSWESVSGVHDGPDR